MENLAQHTVGEIVAQDFRTAAVFTQNKIDFCCGGHKSLAEVCETKDINVNRLSQELQEVLSTKTENAIDFKSWPLDLLAAYIEKTHHRYVQEKSPVILQYLYKLCTKHGERHPELLQIYTLFTECSEELAQHMLKEEHILFPYIEKMVDAKNRLGILAPAPFGSVDMPIQNMIHEHETEGRRLEKIAELTDQYRYPEDACNTYKVTYAMLQEFEEDLHKHIHLENNILFPRAIALEKEL